MSLARSRSPGHGGWESLRQRSLGPLMSDKVLKHSFSVFLPSQIAPWTESLGENKSFGLLRRSGYKTFNILKSIFEYGAGVVTYIHPTQMTLHPTIRT